MLVSHLGWPSAAMAAAAGAVMMRRRGRKRKGSPEPGHLRAAKALKETVNR